MTTENENNWNPGHTIGRGYPFDVAHTKQVWPNRPQLILNHQDNTIAFNGEGLYESKVVRVKERVDGFFRWLLINAPIGLNDSKKALEDSLNDLNGYFTEYLKTTDAEIDFEDFMVHRCYEFSEALKASENQIDDMLHEDPFTPELLGFEPVHQTKGTSLPPQDVYVSIHNPDVMIYRNHDHEKPSMWVMMKKTPEGSPMEFITTELYLPCQRIAYAAFSALMIKMK